MPSAKLKGAAVLAHLSGASHRLDSSDSLRSVRKHVDRHLTRRIPLEEAADVAGYERTYFSTYFRNKVGITYTQWLSALRVSRAVQLISETDLPIAEVCVEAGFGDLRTMERNFQRYLSITPSGLRRRLHRR